MVAGSGTFGERVEGSRNCTRSRGESRRQDESCTLVVFGASGDLTQRMVMPAIFRLVRRGLLSPEFRLIGYARTKLTDDGFRTLMRKAVMREPAEGDEAAWNSFAPGLSYVVAEYDGADSTGYAELARRFAQFDRDTGARQTAGAMRDMVQNHLLQLCALVLCVCIIDSSAPCDINIGH